MNSRNKALLSNWPLLRDIECLPRVYLCMRCIAKRIKVSKNDAVEKVLAATEKLSYTTSESSLTIYIP
jgi:hypothetical protein